MLGRRHRARKTCWICSAGWWTSRWWWRGEYGRRGALQDARAHPPVRRGEAGGERRSRRGAGWHAAYFLALAEEAELRLRGQEEAEWLSGWRREHDNLRAALSWLLERGDAWTGAAAGRSALEVLACALAISSEGVRWLEEALAHGMPARVAGAG